jgi:ABC-2 type transport system ATP-binding protein
MSVQTSTEPTERTMPAATQPARESLRRRTTTRRHCLKHRRHGAGTSAATSLALEVRHLHKRFGERTVVEDVSFSVARGEIFGIVGPNGAGKTTTVESAQGLRQPDAGIIRVLGLDVHRDAKALRGRVGSQLQASALPDRMKVWEAIDLFAAMTPGATSRTELLERWGLVAQRNTCFADLSGGQRQRLFVALALIGPRELVFLDELTQGLDPAARRVAWELIREIRDQGCAVVLVTHYMDEAEHLCDRLAVIDRGHVVATGHSQELLARSRAETCLNFTSDQTELAWLHAVEGVTGVVRHRRRVEVTGHGPLLASVMAALFERGIAPADLRVEQPTLEDAYVELTAHPEEVR